MEKVVVYPGKYLKSAAITALAPSWSASGTIQRQRQALGSAAPRWRASIPNVKIRFKLGRRTVQPVMTFTSFIVRRVLTGAGHFVSCGLEGLSTHFHGNRSVRGMVSSTKYGEDGE